MSLKELKLQAAQTIAEQIAMSQAFLELSDDQLAEQMGYPSGKVVELLKRGSMRLPLNKVYQTATALDLEPGHLMHMALAEIDPTLPAQMERCVGPLKPSPAEVRLIHALREQARGRDISPVMYDGKSLVAVIVA